MRQRFAARLREFESVSTDYATCRYLETIGGDSPKGDAGRLLEVHDGATRCNETFLRITRK